MKNIYILFLSICSGTIAVAQCTSSIPATAVVVNTNQTITANNGFYWVCSGSLNITGNGNTIWVEEDAGASITGTNNTINSKDIVVSQSEDGNGSNTIYVAGFDDAISTNFQDQINGCSAVVFNYSNAPAGGCAGGTGLNDVVALPVHFQVYPNPMNNILNLVIENATRIDQVRLVDLNGRTILQEPGKASMVIGVSMIDAGLYTVIVGTAEGVLVRKLHKE